jgi:Uma2 family endonuclease
MSSQPLVFLTPEEYLAAERKAERKSEYLNGEVFAMSGVSRWHSTVGINLTVRLGVQLGDGPCQVYSADVRVRVNPTGNYLYCYPDLSVVCGEPRFEDNHFDTLLNPKILIEVLSPSTEAYDRLTKATLYRQLPSLEEYLLIAQDRIRVEHYTRQPSGDWSRAEWTNLDDRVELQSVGATLKLAEIYRRVVFS